MITRQTQSDHWKNNKDLRIIQSYWDSPPATLRSKFFASKLKEYRFGSIFEVGFFAGRNLRYIKEEFPNVKISGLEINPKAVKFARDKLSMGEELICMDLHDMDNLSETYDVVITSGVLIHILPEDIREVVNKMIRRANSYIMHLEQTGNNEVAAGPKSLGPAYKISDQIQFSPDLVSIYKDLGYDPQVIPLPEKVQTNGARELVVVKVDE